jgi:Na+:H+ antiporter, NhaA family
MLTLRDVLFKPFLNFLQLQASSSILLLGATILALFWANGPWAETYESFWHTPITLGFGAFQFRESLHFWINDGMMAIFFLVVGLEIKRELLVGELSSPKQAAFPIAAAIGGMLVPALIYLLLHPPGTLLQRGWGIPTVTDIAFAIGVLTLLGNRVPIGLKVFLTALAIVDDLGAILLIALFYSGGLNTTYVLLALLMLVILWLFNRSGMDRPYPYILLGLILWLIFLKSGLHTTIAGVILAFAIPAKAKIDPSAFYEEGCAILERFRKAGMPPDKRIILTDEEHQASVQALESLCEEVQAPLQQVEHALHPWSSHLILPLFALANAGVHLDLPDLPSVTSAILHPVTLAVILGLFIGKQVGITLFAWLAVRLGLAQLPEGVKWTGIYGASILGGIGFTMSLFVSVLAFTSAEHVSYAKFGILLASLLSGLTGILVLRKVLSTNSTETAKS